MIVVRAPVRISFGGGGTDLQAYYAEWGGFVVSATIARYCYVAAGPTRDGSIRINSADYRVWESFERGMLPRVEGQLALPKAAIESFADDLRERGVDLFLAAEVPPGTGLGSSSAMAVALVRALSRVAGSTLTTHEVAERASALEIDQLDMPIGKQDQYASAFGGLNSITFTSTGVAIQPLRMSRRAVQRLQERLLLFATGHSRNSAAILRQQRADTAARGAVAEALHRIKDLAHEMYGALCAEDLDRFGQLLDHGWREKRRLSGKISTAAIDDWYAAARAAGALGGKIAGAGGGGFLLLYCPPEKQAAVRGIMARSGLRELRFDFDGLGVQVLAETALEGQQ